MSMFDKVKQLGELKKMRDQAIAVQKKLAAQMITIDEDDIRIVISGDQKIQQLSVQGIENSLLVEKLNKALKKSQEMAAKQLQEMSGGLSGLMRGMGS